MRHLALLLLVACGTSTPPEPPIPAAAEAQAPPQVEAVSFPAAWLAGRIGGDAVSVANRLPAGVDAPHWQPEPALVASLGEADLVVANGAGFEAFLGTASLPDGVLVLTSHGLDLITLPGVTHSHGKEAEHSHAGLDPHTWSDPLTFLAQGKAVHGAFMAADPSRGEVWDTGYGALQEDLTALHEALQAATAPLKGRSLAANHPAYNYLARRYALDLTSFDLDPETAPSPHAASEVAAWAEAAAAQPGGAVLLWESSPSSAATDALPDTIHHVVLDPLEQPDETGTYDYLRQARANVKVLEGLAPQG